MQRQSPMLDRVPVPWNVKVLHHTLKRPQALARPDSSVNNAPFVMVATNADFAERLRDRRLSHTLDVFAEAVDVVLVFLLDGW